MAQKATTFQGEFDLASNRQSGTAVYFDGVLLNLSELRKESDESPEDIIKRLYSEKGVGAFDMLNGQFAIALADWDRNELVLARDQHGQRGLYYRVDGVKVCYGSAITNKGSLDYEAIADYLSLGYIPSPRTIYKEWRKVPSGCAVVISRDGVCREERYWCPVCTESFSGSFGEAVEEAGQLISKAVKRCLDYAPDAGVLLSGGIDSNVVLLKARDILGASPMAFTVGFPNGSFDERDMAAISAKAAGCEHITRQVEAADYALVQKRLQGASEPFADSSLLPDAVAMELAAGHCKTVLTGDGGDELFGGYRRYQAMAMREKLGEILTGLLGDAGMLLGNFLPRGAARSRIATIRRLARAFSLPPLECYASFQELLNPENVAVLMPRLAESTRTYYDDWRKLLAECSCRSLVGKCNYLDCVRYMPDDCCTKERLASSGTELTVLSPLLDMDVARFALSLPMKYRLDRRSGKRVLRAIAEKQLPQELLHQVKRGFGMPLSDWLRGPLAGIMNETIAKQKQWDIEKTLSADILSRMLELHNASAVDCGAELWSINCLREFFLSH